MSTAALSKSLASASCKHCLQPVYSGGEFCCRGCESVFELLQNEELTTYYDLRRGRGVAVVDVPDPHRDLGWLDEVEVVESHLQLDIQGIHCSGCVWLLSRTFDNQPGALRLTINPTLGRADLWITGEFPLPQWIRVAERFGYRFGPPRKVRSEGADRLLLRLGVCAFLAVNAMMLQAAIYLGLRNGLLYTTFTALIAALAVGSVLVGGPVFFRAAWHALRNGVLALDVPISLGILLAFGGSLWSLLAGAERGLYFDSVSVFVALMVGGRYLQERVLQRNRDALLSHRGVDELRTTVISEGRFEARPSTSLRAGDELLIRPGDLIPVKATLLSPSASLALDWITGEPAPQDYLRGATLPAGACNRSRQAIRVRAAQRFDEGPLADLLVAAPTLHRAAQESDFIARISRVYVPVVLVLAALGGGGYWLFQGASSGLEVATAVLVITCPCAFGIAVPLAHDLVHGHLRSRGLFVRTPDLLDKALSVRQLVFDKTGTLTTGTLELERPESLDGLDDALLRVLANMTARSNHPRSEAIHRALAPKKLAALHGIEVKEHPGLGIEAELDGHRYRLGRASWAARELDDRLIFARDGRALIELSTHEVARPDAVAELRSLRQAGYEQWILSGDEPQRVIATARALGIPEARALGNLRPEDKAAWLENHDRQDTLFLGDGINDSLAATSAHCSGTPALDRPFMASRCDFVLCSAGLGPVALLLRAAHTLRATTRRNLVIAVAYNVFGVGLCFAGLMRPWMAAVLMPASSILIVLLTARSLSSSKLK